MKQSMTKKDVMKYVFAILAAALIGALVGYASMAHSHSARKILFGSIMPKVITFTKTYGAMIYSALVVTLLIRFIQYGKMRKAVDMLLATNEDDPIYDKRYDIVDESIFGGILWNELIFYILHLLFMFTCYPLFIGSDFTPWKFLFLFAGIFVSTREYAGMSRKMMTSFNQIRPEITVNPMDMKFNRKIIQDVNEREREQTYKASYSTYLWMKKFNVIILTVTFVLAIILELRTLPIFISTLYIPVQEFAYVYDVNQETKSV